MPAHPPRGSCHPQPHHPARRGRLPNKHVAMSSVPRWELGHGPSRGWLSLLPAPHAQRTPDPKPNVLAVTDKQPKRCESSRRQGEKRCSGLGGPAASRLAEPRHGGQQLPHCWAAHELPPSLPAPKWGASNHFLPYWR